MAEKSGQEGFAGRRSDLESQILVVGTVVIGLIAVAVGAEQLTGDGKSLPLAGSLLAVAAVWLAGFLTRRPAMVWVCVISLLITGNLIHFMPTFRYGGVVALLVFPLLAMAFVQNWKVPVLVSMAVVTSALSFAIPADRKVGLAAAVFGGVVLVGLVSVRVREEEQSLATRFATLFHLMPIAMFEQDWNPVLRRFEQYRAAGLEDIKGLLAGDPELMKTLLMSVRNLAVNPAAAVMYRVPSPEILLGPPPANLIDDANREYFLDVLVDMWNGVGERDALFPARASDGDLIWQQIRAFPHPDRPGVIILAMVDVTDLQAQRDKLVELHKSKDRFVASISHELRTPLSAVVGFLAELEARGEEFLAEERTEFTGLASREAKAVSNIVEDLLVSARADIGGVMVVHEPVDLRVEVVRMTQRLEPVEVVFEPNIPEVCGDVVRICQVMRNLTTNAQRYGGPRRRIVVSRTDEAVQLEVRDNGDPITPEDMSRIFHPYEQVGERPGVPGSVGLGLTVSRHLAELMGGSLAVGREGDETVFRLELPIRGHCPVKEARPD